MLNIDDNLHSYNFEEGQLFVLENNSVDILESFIIINPKNNFNKFINDRKPLLIDYLNLINISYFENNHYQQKQIFVDDLTKYINKNFVIFNDDFTILKALNELKTMWFVFLVYDYLQTGSKDSYKLLVKILKHLTINNTLKFIIPTNSFKSSYFIDCLSNINDDLLFCKTLKMYLNNILNEHKYALPGIHLILNIESDAIELKNKYPELIHYFWNELVKSIVSKVAYKICLNCNDLFHTTNERKLFCSYSCKNRKSSSDSYNRSKKRNLVKLKSVPGLDDNKPYRIITS
tara:strand:+ start:3395 stop:4264 length:870 start_codon:yes stop_codon:yes gene_type:complete